MDDKNGKTSFVQEMNTVLLQYQLEKIRKQEAKFQSQSDHFKQERQAKNTLIELDNAVDTSRISQEDIFIGRWSQYRVPQKIEERLSLNKRSKKHGDEDRQFFRYNPNRQKTCLQYNCSSQKTIPKLKVILNQLQQPLHLPPNHNSKNTPLQICKRMKNHIGRQALVISNKQQIKPSAKSQRKMISTIDSVVQGIENKRPQSNYDNLTTINNSNGSYQKIKRQFGFSNHQEKEIQYQKQLLSQLIKGKCGVPQPQTSNLANMLDYFTQASQKKKRTPAKLGLDRLLS